MVEMIKMLKNKLIFGKYKIIKLIDKDSFGYIYKGINVENKKLLQLKLNINFVTTLL